VHRLVAAKSNYFGVGGGTRDFERFIQNDNTFSISTCHTIKAGMSLVSCMKTTTSF